MTPHWIDSAVSDDPYRPHLCRPFGVDINGQRYRVATDGHCMLIVPDATAEINPDAPRADAVLYLLAGDPGYSAPIVTTVDTVRDWARCALPARACQECKRPLPVDVRPTDCSPRNDQCGVIGTAVVDLRRLDALIKDAPAGWLGMTYGTKSNDPVRLYADTWRGAIAGTRINAADAAITWPMPMGNR